MKWGLTNKIKSSKKGEKSRKIHFMGQTLFKRAVHTFWDYFTVTSVGICLKINAPLQKWLILHFHITKVIYLLLLNKIWLYTIVTSPQ